jgi:hypothetical protein
MSTMTFEPEGIDLAELARELDQAFEGKPPVGYLLGRTALRDATVQILQSSLLEAEEVVDTMVAHGFLRYEGAPAEEVDDLLCWRISDQPGFV